MRVQIQNLHVQVQIIPLHKCMVYFDTLINFSYILIHVSEEVKGHMHRLRNMDGNRVGSKLVAPILTLS